MIKLTVDSFNRTGEHRDMKKLYVAIIVIIASILCLRAEASDYHIVDLDELSIDYKNYKMVREKNYNTLTYPENIKEGINVNINTTILGAVYWNNTIETLTTEGQYRTIGLQLGLGVRLTDYIEVGYYHHSQHLLDRQHSFMNHFPVEDAVEIKFYLYRGNSRNKTLF